jgi:ABC-type amino acid transport system permease subunit
MPTFGSNFLGLSVEVSNRGLSLSLSARSVVPDFHGINKLTRWTSSTEFLSLVLSLALFGAVSISEIIRGAMAAVDVGQIEAGRALGLSERQIFWKVIWPQAILAAIAPVTNLYIFILRMTTLGSSVGYIDLYAVSNLAIAQTGQLLPFLITLATVMSGICIFIARASRILEYLLHRRMRLGSPM